MSACPPERARAVIVGGGVSGCSVAYHLARAGWKEVVLLERRQLTCGTTWHAAGLVGQLRTSRNMTRLARYSAELYTRLEKETGIATGMRRVGSITVALTGERREELYRTASLARAFGVEVSEVTAAEVKAMYPHLEVGRRDRRRASAGRRPVRPRQYRPGARQRRAGGGRHPHRRRRSDGGPGRNPQPRGAGSPASPGRAPRARASWPAT